jgi:hypothetical protein
MMLRRETGTPCFSAKLIAARVGSPTESKATDFGGPVISLRHIFLFYSNSVNDGHEPSRRAKCFK